MKRSALIPISVCAMALLAMVYDSSATIRSVPSQYITIQLAIDAAVIGDTVLVSDGTYYENIRFKGKRIVVASTYLTTNDTTHISLTIIDGSRSTYPDSGSVVYFVNGEDTTSMLCGFTITGGNGTLTYLPEWAMWSREGGGVFCESAGARIVRNSISRNRIDEPSADGGGLFAFDHTSSFPYLILERNRISDNLARGIGLGIYPWGGGAALFNTSVRIVGNVFERDTSAGGGGGGGWGEGGAVAGALGVMSYPENANIVGLIQGNIFRENICMTMAGAVWGGAVAVEHTGPVTITKNLFEGNIATIAGGAYPWARGGGLWIGDELMPGNIAPGRKLIVGNRFIHNVATGPWWSSGGAIELDGSLATIAQNEISHNVAAGSAYGGGGIFVYRSSVQIENNIIVQNSASVDGGGVLFDSPPMPLHGTGQVIVNNTICENKATYGGGLSVTSSANIVSLNNILWADTAQSGKEIYVSGGIADVHYCSIQGGLPSGTGNIGTDPLFVQGDSLLNLTVESPCIGKGIDSLQIAGVWYHAPTIDYDGHSRPRPVGTHPDIGAQEDQIVVVSVDQREQYPVSYQLDQNYPNPFNPTTKIGFRVSGLGSSWVRLAMYDVLGREVAVMVNEKKEPGVYEVKFDGSNLASGVYFYRLQAGDPSLRSGQSFVQSKKLAIVK